MTRSKACRVTRRRLLKALIRRDHGDSNIEAVLGGNFRRLLGDSRA